MPVRRAVHSRNPGRFHWHQVRLFVFHQRLQHSMAYALPPDGVSFDMLLTAKEYWFNQAKRYEEQIDQMQAKLATSAKECELLRKFLLHDRKRTLESMQSSK